MSEVTEDWVSIPEVGIILGKPYQRARDLVISGKLGEVKIEDNGRYFVKRSFVDQYKTEQGGT